MHHLIKIVSLSAAFVVALSLSHTIADEKTSHRITVNGNELETVDSVVSWISSGKGVPPRRYAVVNALPVPVKVNGERVYNYVDVMDALINDQDKLNASNLPGEDELRELEQYLFNALEPEFAQLPDGRYRLRISNMVVDKAGKIIYYNYCGMVPPEYDGVANLPDSLTQLPAMGIIGAKVSTLLDKAPPLGRFTWNGTPCYYLVNGLTSTSSITVKDHQLKVRYPAR